jgi:hypothetical protein
VEYIDNRRIEIANIIICIKENYNKYIHSGFSYFEALSIDILCKMIKRYQLNI